MDGAAEIRAEDLVSKKSGLFSLRYGLLQALDRERVFGAAVDIALVGSDRVGADDHALEYRVGVALKQRAVHERAGVALVGVADDIFLRARRLLAEAPLHACREPAAAAAAESGLLHLFDDLLRRHREKDLRKSFVAVGSDVFLKRVGVDVSAVLEDEAVLLLVEVDVSIVGNALRREGFFEEQAVHDTSLDEVFADYFRNVGLLHVGVEGPLRVDDDEGTLLAESLTAGLYYLYFLIKAVRLEFFFEFRNYLS
ncbi:hypothetical protein SDC9_86879 [bioreactor metagenome]|uniref:Uncharacterized protein n=1 Tax=bioreactor metagenome TaxID=1076179 RepID=A0A644ZHF0_9ZZZZ